MAAKPKHADRILAMVRHIATAERIDLSASKFDRYAMHVTLCTARVGMFRRHVRYGIYDWQTRGTVWFSDAALAAAAFVAIVGLTRARRAAEALAKRHGFTFPDAAPVEADDASDDATVNG
jgi:hypothetical protein